MKPRINAPLRLGVIYARYSSHAQNDASIEQQIEECREYASGHNIEISGIYADRAVSGRTDNRPEFQRLLRHAAAGRFEVVVAYKSNRIARNMLHALACEDKLGQMGVNVVYCKEEFGDNAAGRFALRTMMNVNQFYSENMAEDIQRGMLDRAKQCKCLGRAPFGYATDTDGHLIADPEAAPVVQEIFARVADGETLAALADDLNARHVKTHAGRTWGRNSFNSILRNQRYLGTYIFDEIRIEGGLPQLVDGDTFERVQTLLNDRGAVRGRRRGNGTYLLTGTLYCGKCGSPMIGISGTSKYGSTYFYYGCSAQHRRHACDKKMVRRELAEALVVDRLVHCVLMDPHARDWMADRVIEYQEGRRRASQLERLREALADTQKALGNVLKAIEAGVFSASVHDRLNALEAQRAELTARIKAEEADALTVTRDDIFAWLDSFCAGNIDGPKFREKIVRSFVERAYIYDNSLTTIFTPAKQGCEADVLANIREFGARFDLGTHLHDARPFSGFTLYTGRNGVPEPAGTNTIAFLQNGAFVFATKNNNPMWRE